MSKPEWKTFNDLPVGWRWRLVHENTRHCVHCVVLTAQCFACSEGWIKREEEEQAKYTRFETATEAVERAAMFGSGIRFDAGKLDWTEAPWEVFERMLEEKVDWSLLRLMIPALAEVVRVLEAGAKRYDRDNWYKGIKYRRNLAASLRHQVAYLMGENRDPDPAFNTYHWANAICSLLFVGTYDLEGRAELDDRPRSAKRPTASQADDSWRGTRGDREGSEAPVRGGERPGTDPDAGGRRIGPPDNPLK